MSKEKMIVLMGLFLLASMVLAGAAGATQRAVLAELMTNTG
jgi:hypothetical protein